MLFFLGAGYAQNCLSFMPLEEGYQWETTSFNKKGKEEGKSTSVIKVVSSDGDASSATVDMTVSDGKEEHSSTYTITCDGSTIKMSMSVFIPEEQMKQMESSEGMDIELDMDDMEFPGHLEVGQELKDAKMTMSAKMNGMQVMSSTTIIKSRKVVSIETITTSAGTFECFKIEQVSEFSMGFMKKEFKSVSYVAEGVGVVRSENYNKKGEIDSYQEITAIN